MKKPLHWKNIADENKAILSTVCMLKPYIMFTMIDQGYSIDDIESVIWAEWEEHHKELRPHVYSLLKVSKKIVDMIHKKIINKRTGKVKK